MPADNWFTISESQFVHEREALEFVRERFPAHDPYRAWSNFEFTDDHGNIREIDLLTFTPQGVLLVEIKSWRGVISGDSNYWNLLYDGKRICKDNPRILANTKAKSLKNLLDRQDGFRLAKLNCPFIEAVVFLSDPKVRVELTQPMGVLTRDEDNKPGIMAAITRRGAGNLEPRNKPPLDRTVMKAFRKAMDDLGIRPSNRSRKVNNYLLEQSIADEPGYQDWSASHVSVTGDRRRVRIYLVRDTLGKENRDQLDRAAKREYQILVSLSHPGILRAYDLSAHEMGPAVLFEAPADAQRLDHFILERQKSLSEGELLALLRRIAEAVEFAHRKGVVHRALSPRNILVTDVSTDSPGIRLFNWQTGFRGGPGGTITATSHVDQFVDDLTSAYLAPEVYTDETPSSSLDVFSLGAIGYFLFTGQHPAENHSDLLQKLQRDQSLSVSSVIDGASPALDNLVRTSTRGDLDIRLEGVDAFLRGLDRIEEELTAPENEYKGDPAKAQLNDILPGGYTIIRRLGQGSTAVAYLVSQSGRMLIMKVASQSEHGDRLEQEYHSLRKVHPHAHVIQPVDCKTILGRVVLLLEPVFADTQCQVIDTLAQRLSREGRLQAELLERFGCDLLGIVEHLENKGIFHRDIKPENIAVGQGASRRLRLTLFDFSLAAVPLRNTKAGTMKYLDPMLALSDRNMFDTAAERYSTAVTLYQMAVGMGSFPEWGDGRTEPTMLPPTTVATIHPELFDASLREPLTRFFRKAFERERANRYDNAEEMSRAWRECFNEGAKSTDADGESVDTDRARDQDDQPKLPAELEFARLDTPIHELGLSHRAANALDRVNLLTVGRLLGFSGYQLFRLPGVGSKTRREINAAVKRLRERLGNPEPEPVSPNPDQGVDPARCPLPAALDAVVKACAAQQRKAARTLLGLDGIGQELPSLAQVARHLSLTPGRISQLLVSFRPKWEKVPEIIALGNQIAEALDGERAGGAMTLPELSEHLVSLRGSTGEKQRDLETVRALIRAAAEVESLREDPRYLVRRQVGGIVVARNDSLARLAFALGERADQLAGQELLPSQQRAIEQLRTVVPNHPALVALHENRLLRLAAAASCTAALSSRNEIYPRGMPAARALRLCQGALAGLRTLGIDEIRERVRNRYPESQSLPDRPHLDDLIREAGVGLVWDETASGGRGGYVPPAGSVSVSSGSSSLDRRRTIDFGSGDLIDSAEAITARQFEERLERSIRNPCFLTLLVNPRHFIAAKEELTRRYAATTVDLEDLFITALEETAKVRNANFDVVVKADAARRDDPNWGRLMKMVSASMPRFEQLLNSACGPAGNDQADRVILMHYPGLLARYGHMNQLDRIIGLAGRRDGLPAVWLLLSGEQAIIEGEAVPLINSSSKARIPIEWLENRHRGIA